MKLKRMAAVAAAAVVGPVLLTTPAMAEDQQQPAVTVPDTAPTDDASTGGTAEETTQTAGEQETKKGDGTEKASEQEAEKAAVTPLPAPETKPAPAQAPATGEKTQAPKDSATADAPQDSMLMGPDVTVAGIPKDGFKAGGGWTPLTVTVDNSAHIEVPRYTPRITLSQSEGKLKADRIKVERLITDAAGNKSWQPAEFIAGHNNSYFAFGLGTKASVARESVYTVDLRISFAADTAVVPFKMYSDGLSIRPDGGKAWSGATWYETSIAGADADTGSPIYVDGPSLTLNGVPADGFKVGGDWTQLGLHVDNTGKQALNEFRVAFIAARPDWVRMNPDYYLQVEVYGKNGWERLNVGYADGSLVYYQIGAPGPIASGQTADVKLRIRFTKDAPLGDIVLQAMGEAEDLGSGGRYVFIDSHSPGRLTKIVAADANTGNLPKPNGGTTVTPISTGTGTGTGTTANGGELAATGSDSATTWALGGAGTALALGAALVAGTGRHRRRTSA